MSEPIDLDDLQRVGVLVREQTGDNWLADMVEIACDEIARLRDALKIYVHVHETGNKVPPAIFRHKVLMVVAADVKEVGRE